MPWQLRSAASPGGLRSTLDRANLSDRTACAGRMASACNTASAAVCSRGRAVAPTIGAGTCIGTRAAKAGARRQSDNHSARESPFDRATTHRYPSGQAAGTGTHRTTAGWKSSILICRGHAAQIARLRVSESSQPADSFSGLPTASSSLSARKAFGCFRWHCWQIQENPPK